MEITALSYNIRAGLGTDFKRSASRVLERIGSYRPDVVFLQEADFRMGRRPSALPRDLIEEMTGLVPVPLGQYEESIGWHGNALLLPSSWKAVIQDRFSLPGLEPRGAFVVESEGWRFVGVHLGLLRHSRRRQLRFLVEALSSLCDKPTIVAGDFNEWSLRVGLGRLASHYTLMPAIKTFPSTRPFLSLDRMASSCDVEMTPMMCDVSSRFHPSDHNPLLARAKVKGIGS